MADYVDTLLAEGETVAGHRQAALDGADPLRAAADPHPHRRARRRRHRVVAAARRGRHRELAGGSARHRSSAWSRWDCSSSPSSGSRSRSTAGCQRRYVVTTRRVLYAQGAVRRTANDAGLEKITDVAYKQSVLGRKLGYGDLSILTAAGSPLVFDDIIDALDFKKAIMAGQEALVRERAGQILGGAGPAVAAAGRDGRGTRRAGGRARAGSGTPGGAAGRSGSCLGLGGRASRRARIAGGRARGPGGRDRDARPPVRPARPGRHQRGRLRGQEAGPARPSLGVVWLPRSCGPSAIVRTCRDPCGPSAIVRSCRDPCGPCAVVRSFAIRRSARQPGQVRRLEAAPVGVRGDGLVGTAEPEQRRLVPGPADELEADRQALRQPARHRHARAGRPR